MRIFEIVLVLVNLLCLVMALKHRPKAWWIGAAGVNLAVFAAHGLLEGLRYQMAFSYLFVVLAVVMAFVKTRRPAGARTSKALKLPAAGLGVALLALTALLAYALPVFSLPKPTGSHAVGAQYFHWVDADRPDPFLDMAPQPRALMVKVYYPAQPDDSKPYSPYFNGSVALIRAFASFYNMPGFLFDHFRLVRTNSKAGLPLADGQPAYPVVLFSHGAGTSMEVQTAQSEDLASHGYVVVAIDHTYTSAATAFPDRVVSSMEATTNFDTVEPAEIITQIMADDAAFVIDQLAEMNAGNPGSPFAGRLDLDHIGAVGHSVGGAVAYNLALNDRRVKAAINLDGRVYLTPEEGKKEVAPLLVLFNDQYHVETLQHRRGLMDPFEELTPQEQEDVRFMFGSQEAYQEAYHKDYQNAMGLIRAIQTSGALYTITGSDHMKFSDIGLFFGARWVREQINIRGETGPERCLEITRAITRTFFDRHLKDNGETLDALATQYPELEKVELK